MLNGPRNLKLNYIFVLICRTVLRSSFASFPPATTTQQQVDKSFIQGCITLVSRSRAPPLFRSEGNGGGMEKDNICISGYEICVTCAALESRQGENIVISDVNTDVIDNKIR